MILYERCGLLYFIIFMFKDTRMARKPLLEIANVYKTYGNHNALNGVSLSLYPGEIVALLGVNGAGKTTLSSIICTLHKPTSGDVLYNGVSIYKDIPTFRRDLGYCQQKPNLHPLLTIKDTLVATGRYYGMTNQQIENRMQELDKQIGIGKYLHAYPAELSGGWKQRYMIARTLMHSPRLVVFDEPTVALDPDIRRQLLNYIIALKNEGVCVLITTHYIEDAQQLADRVCVLDRGSVVLVDTPHNLMHSFAKNNLEDVFLHIMEQNKD